MKYRTPIKEARGLGSAKDGTHHWWVQRVSAVALIPLSLWFVASLVSMMTGDGGLSAAAGWVAAPHVTVLLVLFLAVGFHHAELGVQVVIEDYVHTGWLKMTALLLSKFFHYLLAAIGIYAVLRIAFGS